MIDYCKLIALTLLICASLHASQSSKSITLPRKIPSLNQLCIMPAAKTLAAMNICKEHRKKAKAYLKQIENPLFLNSKQVKSAFLNIEKSVYDFIPPTATTFVESPSKKKNRYRGVCRINKSTIASTSKAGIIFWDILTKQATHTIPEDPSIQRLVLFNNQFLFAESLNDKVHLIDLIQHKNVKTFENVVQVCPNHDGTQDAIHILHKDWSAVAFHLSSLEYGEKTASNTLKSEVIKRARESNMPEYFIAYALDSSMQERDKFIEFYKPQPELYRGKETQIHCMYPTKIHTTLYASGYDTNITLWHWDCDQLTLTQLLVLINAALKAQKTTASGQLPSLRTKYNLAKAALDEFDPSNDLECKYKDLIEQFAHNPNSKQKEHNEMKKAELGSCIISSTCTIS